MKKYFVIVFANLILLSVFGVYYVQRRCTLDVLSTAKTDNNLRQINTLLKRALEEKDTAAYDKLRTIYINRPNEGEFLFFSILMANKCHYPQSYYDVYHELRSIEFFDKKNYSSETRKLMIESLMIGAKLGHSQSKYELGQLYIAGKYLSKDTILGKKLMLSSGFIRE